MKIRTTIAVFSIIVLVAAAAVMLSVIATQTGVTTTTATMTTTTTTTMTTTTTTTAPPLNGVLSVYLAGSLAQPFGTLENQFERTWHNVDVQLNPFGSVDAIVQITQLHKAADILASADYSLIPQMMYPDYANWEIQFARNDLVIAYTPESHHSNEINGTNWYKILDKGDVRFGFSNPSSDPAGYRSVMTIQLAETYYDNSMIFDDLIASNCAITSAKQGDNYLLTSPKDLNPNVNKVEISDKSVSLIAKLQAHSIDYAFEYRSVAVQYGLNFVELPVEINLSDANYANTYGSIQVKLANENIVKGGAIVYGITIPKNAPNEAAAIEFVKLLITDYGNKVFVDAGQPPIVPAIADDISKLPKSLQPLVIQ